MKNTNIVKISAEISALTDPNSFATFEEMLAEMLTDIKKVSEGSVIPGDVCLRVSIDILDREDMQVLSVKDIDGDEFIINSKFVEKNHLGFSISRPVFLSKDGTHFKPGENDIRFLVIDHKNHKIEYHQTSVVTQNGKVWVVTQKKSSVGFHQKTHGNLQVFGRIREGLVKALCSNPAFQKKILKGYPRKPAYHQSKPKYRFAENEGFLDWWDHSRQTGVVSLFKNGRFQSAKVHWKDVPFGFEGRRFLEEGRFVTCRIRANKQTRSSLSYEAYEVRYSGSSDSVEYEGSCLATQVSPATLEKLDAFVVSGGGKMVEL